MTLNRSDTLRPLEQRRGSMPLPLKHQLQRTEAVDEPDWPQLAAFEPSTKESCYSNSSDSVISSNSDLGSHVYKVVLLGESGVGKTALAGIFGGLEENFPHDMENAEDTYERTITVDEQQATLVLYDIWEQNNSCGWMQDNCMQMGDAFLLIFSVTDRESFDRAAKLCGKLIAQRQNQDIPIILVGNKSDLVRSREVSAEEGRTCAVSFNCKYIETSAALHHNTRKLFEGVVRQIKLRRDGKEEVHKRRESLTKKAKRFLQSLVTKNNKFFKQRSKSCHDLSVL
ncbi:GTP-binding protein REM 2 [Protopterus annectens]|uniref:GTP-binding protein REM 2 n=1 Tax=Protopterus annectens TaxID=7888 RepID=UPI001CFB7C3A|nr:GTP-binding protein REM 2 [Protopterus annectens]